MAVAPECRGCYLEQNRLTASVRVSYPEQVSLCLCWRKEKGNGTSSGLSCVWRVISANTTSSRKGTVSPCVPYVILKLCYLPQDCFPTCSPGVEQHPQSSVPASPSDLWAPLVEKTHKSQPLSFYPPVAFGKNPFAFPCALHSSAHTLAHTLAHDSFMLPSSKEKAQSKKSKCVLKYKILNLLSLYEPITHIIFVLIFLKKEFKI